MITSVPFDTHAYVKKLLGAGFTEAQAEVQAQALAELVNDQLATKRDMKELEVRLVQVEANLQRDLKGLEITLRRDLEVMRIESRRDLKELELRITIRLGALIAGGVGLIVVLDQILR